MPTPNTPLTQSRHIGVLPVNLFVLLLEGKASCKGTGITMPSDDAIKRAPSFVKDLLRGEDANLDGLIRLSTNCFRASVDMFVSHGLTSFPWLLASRLGSLLRGAKWPSHYV